jgi:hypothetical protein
LLICLKTFYRKQKDRIVVAEFIKEAVNKQGQVEGVIDLVPETTTMTLTIILSNKSSFQEVRLLTILWIIHLHKKIEERSQQKVKDQEINNLVILQIWIKNRLTTNEDHPLQLWRKAVEGHMETLILLPNKPTHLSKKTMILLKPEREWLKTQERIQVS